MLKLFSFRNSVNALHLPKCLATVPKSFDEAKSALNTLKAGVDDGMKLKIYALFKQASEGVNTKPKPGAFDFVNRAKWQAWSDLGDMPKEKASAEYISLVAKLVLAENPGADSSAATDTPSAAPNEKPTSILTQFEENGVLNLTLNRPQKKNAITWEMYEKWLTILNNAATDKKVKVVTITGAGDFFCSGNDLSNFIEATKPGADLTKMVADGKNLLNRFTASIINFPKPLVGLINGPAIGISVTTLPLYDCILASDKATFHVPLVALGQTPEGISSYTFPKIMGFALANDILLFGRKLTAEEAREAGLVTDVFPMNTFEAEAKRRVAAMAALSPTTMAYAKELIRAGERAQMHEVNQIECERLAERWASPDCAKAIAAFLTRGK